MNDHSIIYSSKKVEMTQMQLMNGYLCISMKWNII